VIHCDDVHVAGGGSPEGQAAMHFSQPANRVHMLVCDTSLENTLSQYLVDRIASASDIEVRTCAEVTALGGPDVPQ
jgi:thioredoxin reductase (NADPH)